MSDLDSNTPLTKVCTRCRRDLPVECFSPSKLGRLGLQAHCRECHREIGRKYQSRPEAKEKRRARYLLHREDNLAKSRLYFREHYKPIERYAPLAERFRAKTRETESGCIEWTGCLSTQGYGRIRSNGVTHYAHRLAYEWAKGPIPEGMQIDHLCRNRACVNPEHLEAVTHQTNVARGVSPMADQKRQTHCKRGHPLDGDNLYLTKAGKRQCRECIRLRSRGFTLEE